MPTRGDPLDFYPQPTGNPQLDDALRIVFDDIYSLRSTVGLVRGEIPPAGLTIDQIRKDLQLGGIAPLNLTGLIGSSNLQFGTHAKRLSTPAASYPKSFWIETDRNQALYYSNSKIWILIYSQGLGSFENRWGDLGTNDLGAWWIENSRNSVTAATDLPSWRWSGNSWIFIQGQLVRSSNQIGTLSATLTVNDGGLLLLVTDLPHQLLWNTIGWQFAPGDPGSGYIVAAGNSGIFSNPSAWGVCDGNSYLVLHGDGSNSSITTPDLTGGVFLRGGSPGNQVPANRATWEATAAVDGANLTSNNTSLTIDPVGNHAHGIQFIVASNSYAGGNNASAVLGMNGSTDDAGAHTHNISPDPHNHTLTPNPHSHNLSNNNAQLKPFSDANGGLPLRISLAWFLRR